MNKKFISGTIFGLVLGMGIGVTTPMFGAKDIVIQKSKPAKSTTVYESQTPAASNDSSAAANAEIVNQLKQLNATMKENNAQNAQIIQGINNINSKAGLGG